MKCKIWSRHFLYIRWGCYFGIDRSPDPCLQSTLRWSWHWRKRF